MVHLQGRNESLNGHQCRKGEDGSHSAFIDLSTPGAFEKNPSHALLDTPVIIRDQFAIRWIHSRYGSSRYAGCGVHGIVKSLALAIPSNFFSGQNSA